MNRSTSWYPHVAALAEAGPVFGIDMPGDANPSVQRAPLAPPASCAAWLDELLAQLSDRPAIVAFITDQAGGKQAAQPARPQPSRGGRT